MHSSDLTFTDRLQKQKTLAAAADDYERAHRQARQYRLMVMRHNSVAGDCAAQRRDEGCRHGLQSSESRARTHTCRGEATRHAAVAVLRSMG